MKDDLDKYRLLSLRVYENRLASLFRVLNENDHDAILIKGWAALRNYEDPAAREPGDMDLVINPADERKIPKLLDKLEGLPVDLHIGPRHLDTLGFEELLSNSETVELLGTSVRVLSPEDHLRVLCVHWLTDGGERKGRLWDIYWAVENRPLRFDWGKCLDVVSPRRRRWVIYTIALANRCLGLDISGLPFRGELADQPKWIARTVERSWKKGVEHVPLDQCLGDWKLLIAQLRKRIPPNPLMATIAMEGSLDAVTRAHYRLGFLLKSAAPSLKRIVGRIDDR